MVNQVVLSGGCVQNSSLTDNWIWRAVSFNGATAGKPDCLPWRPKVAIPKLASPNSVFGLFRLAWFKTLKKSARRFSQPPSPSQRKPNRLYARRLKRGVHLLRQRIPL